jgi:hypothetical protein
VYATDDTTHAIDDICKKVIERILFLRIPRKNTIDHVS